VTSQPPSPPATTDPPATSRANQPETPAAVSDRPPRHPRRPPGGDQPAGGLPPPPLPQSTPRRRAPSGPAASSAGSAPGQPTTLPTTTTSSSSASTEPKPDPFLAGPKPPGPRAERLLSLERVRGFVDDAFDTVTDEANTRRRLNPEQIPDLWLADEDDHRDVPAPIARIIYRRLPAGSDELGNPDLADAVEAFIALWFYARKQFRKLRDWRRVKSDLTDPLEEPNAA
jgi:hypothetical protein